MKIRTNIKAGQGSPCSPHNCGSNHNEKLESDKAVKSLTVKTGVKAGGLDSFNHNEKLASDKKTKTLTVKTGIKAGAGEPGKIEFPN